MSFWHKKNMVVRNMVRYMHDSFRNFSISFQILKIRKAYRVQVHPGAKVNFGSKTCYLVSWDVCARVSEKASESHARMCCLSSGPAWRLAIARLCLTVYEGGYAHRLATLFRSSPLSIISFALRTSATVTRSHNFF